MVVARFLGCVGEVVAAHPGCCAVIVGHGGVYTALYRAPLPERSICAELLVQPNHIAR